MKKTVLLSRQFLVALIISLFLVFLYTIFWTENLDSYDYTMFTLMMVNVLIASITNVSLGLIVTAFILFGYGSIVMYQDFIGANIILKLNYIWIGAFPITTFFAGMLGENLKKIAKDIDYCINNCERFKTIDEDTGFRNLNQFIKDLEIEMAKSKRYNHPLTLGMIEILYFDELRAIHKEDMNRVFKALARALTTNMRIEDSKYRVGEKTFAITLPHTDIKGAEVLKNRVKEELLQLTVMEDEVYKNFKFEIKIGLKEVDDTIEDPLKFKKVAEKEIEYDV